MRILVVMALVLATAGCATEEMSDATRRPDMSYAAAASRSPSPASRAAAAQTTAPGASAATTKSGAPTANTTSAAPVANTTSGAPPINTATAETNATTGVPATNTTPYFWFSPQLGRWVMLVGAPGGTLLPDPNFAIEFTVDSQVTFGQYHRGTYRFIERDTLELRLAWSEGPQKGQALPPILFKIAFYDNGRMMALINGANVIAFQRIP